MVRMDLSEGAKRVESIVKMEDIDDGVAQQLKEIRTLCDGGQDIPLLGECQLCLSVLHRGAAFFAHQGLAHPLPYTLQVFKLL